MRQTFKASDHNKHAVTNHHHHHHYRRTPIYQSAKPQRSPLVKQRTGINVQSSFHDLACNQISQSITVLIISKYTSRRPEFCRLLNCISPATLVITISSWQTISIVTAACFSRVGAYFKTFWNPWMLCTFFIRFGLIKIYRVSNPNVHLYKYNYCLHCLLEYAT